MSTFSDFAATIDVSNLEPVPYDPTARPIRTYDDVLNERAEAAKKLANDELNSAIRAKLKAMVERDGNFFVRLNAEGEVEFRGLPDARRLYRRELENES